MGCYILENLENGSMSINLTRRQGEFIEKLIDLNDEVGAPIHYSLLAERLGVSPFTAYDMLCILEEKGLVTSEYYLPAERTGPGRAERFFFPRAVASRWREAISGSNEFKNLVIDLIESIEGGIPDEALVNVPAGEMPELKYCAGVLNVAALLLEPWPGGETLQTMGSRILSAVALPRERLLLLGGLIFGILAQDRRYDDARTRSLLKHLEGYIRIVNRISQDECDQLVERFSGYFEHFNPQTSLS
jgi:energy-coupling factor transport system substrate-specific component